MTELKSASKFVLADARELHEACGTPDLSDLQAYLLVATAALRLAEALDNNNEDVARDLKRARKLLHSHIPTAEANPVAEDHQLDLGQYAHTKVFEGDSKKVEKFARLMGGGKGEAATHHNTFAPDSKTSERITHEIAEQFNAAVNHKGKKGLGC